MGTEPAAATQVAQVEAQTPQTPQSRWTEEDIVKARQQEKAKLYPQIEALKAQVDALTKAQDEVHSAEEQAAREAEELARLKAESEMDTRQLLERKEQEWAAKLDAERQAREAAMATLQREREFQELQAYRDAKVAAAVNSGDLMPHLADLVGGNTAEEIDSSLTSHVDRSTRIFEDARAASQSNRREMPGARITAPSNGPLDTNPEQQTQQLSPEQIRGMSMNEYAKNRSMLLGASPTARGLFG